MKSIMKSKSIHSYSAQPSVDKRKVSFAANNEIIYLEDDDDLRLYRKDEWKHIIADNQRFQDRIKKFEKIFEITFCKRNKNL